MCMSVLADNPCQGQCSHLCVQSTTSIRCLCPIGMRLGDTGRRCVNGQLLDLLTIHIRLGTK